VLTLSTERGASSAPQRLAERFERLVCGFANAAVGKKQLCRDCEHLQFLFFRNFKRGSR
jgi:hypothetical protein